MPLNYLTILHIVNCIIIEPVHKYTLKHKPCTSYFKIRSSGQLHIDYKDLYPTNPSVQTPEGCNSDHGVIHLIESMDAINPIRDFHPMLQLYGVLLYNK